MYICSQRSGHSAVAAACLLLVLSPRGALFLFLSGDLCLAFPWGFSYWPSCHSAFAVACRLLVFGVGVRPALSLPGKICLAFAQGPHPAQWPCGILRGLPFVGVSRRSALHFV